MTIDKPLKFILNGVFLFLVTFLVLPAEVQAYVSVKGYYRSNGTYVAPHVRSNPNGLKYDNYGYKPSQGLYNSSYGTRSATWDTPTYITDPNYYEGKSLYEKNKTSSGGYYSAYTPSPVALPTKSVSYVTSNWVANNPETPCNQAVSLRSNERNECMMYKTFLKSYEWNVTTTELDGIHYRYDTATKMIYSCGDGYSFRYDIATGKPKEKCYPDI